MKDTFTLEFIEVMPNEEKKAKQKDEIEEGEEDDEDLDNMSDDAQFRIAVIKLEKNASIKF